MKVSNKPGGISPEHRIPRLDSKVEKRSLWRRPKLSDLPKTSGIKTAKVLRHLTGKLLVVSKLMNAVRKKQQIDLAKLAKQNLPPAVVRLLSPRAKEL